MPVLTTSMTLDFLRLPVNKPGKDLFKKTAYSNILGKERITQTSLSASVQKTIQAG